MFKSFVTKYFWLILIIIFLFLRLPSLFEPYWYGDEGIYLTLGQGINHGLVLYRQIHDNKPPTLYLLAAISQTVFGFRLLLLFWLVPTYYFFYRLASRLLPRYLLAPALFLFVVLTSIPTIEGNIANAEIYMLLPTILGLYLALRRPQLKSIDLFFAGLALGIAFTFKAPVIADFGFLFLYIFITAKDKVNFILHKSYFLLLGFVLPITLYALYYWLIGSFPFFAKAALLQNFGYLSSWSTGSHTSSFLSGGLALRILVAAVAYVFLFFICRLKKISSATLFLLAWFVAALFGSLLSGRPYPHYLIQLAPALVLLLVSLFQRRLNLFNRLLCLAFLALMALSINRYQFYFYATTPYYLNFYSYAVGSKNTANYRQYFGDNVNSFYQIADYIDRQTSPSDRLFIWGDAPFIYALSNRLPVGRFTAAYHIVDFNGYDETINKIKAYLPPVIVYYPQPSRPFAKLDDILARYYYLDQTFDPVLIYRLRS